MLNDHQPKRLSIEAIVLCVIAGIVLPTFWFEMDVQLFTPIPYGAQIPAQFKDYLGMLVDNRVASVFRPVLLAATLCLVLVLVRPQLFGRLFIVRFGLLVGVVLCGQFWIVVGGDMGKGALYPFGAYSSSSVPWWAVYGFEALLTAALVGCWGLWLWARKRFGWRMGVLITVPSLLVPVMMFVFSVFQGPASRVILAGMGCSAAWPFAVFLLVRLWLSEHVPWEPDAWAKKSVFAAVWVGAYAVAWGFAVNIIRAATSVVPTGLWPVP